MAAMADGATKAVAILGTFVADLIFVGERLPGMAETLFGEDFRIGPGGKASNQAVAARRAGVEVRLVTKLGRDDFGDMARKLYAAEGISERHLIETAEHPTGAASVFVDSQTGENAIIVVAGAGATITPTEVDHAADGIATARVFVTQLEVAPAAAAKGLEIARQSGVTTVFNPAPAASFPESMYASVDFLTPNTTEAAMLAEAPVRDLDEAEAAADHFLSKGVGAAVITLGGDGVFVKSEAARAHLPAFDAGAVVETTGAGDAFNGAFAAALAEGASVLEAARFGCAAGALSVTRPGTALAMPRRSDIETLLDGG